MKKIPVSVSFSDDRGEITDLLAQEDINAVTLISFTKGAVRANHYHRHTYQWNYVISGKIRLLTQLINGDEAGKVEETILEAGDFAVTVPGESHALQALEESRLMVFTKGPRGGKEYESDTFRLKNPLIP
ncbi:MAG: cupin domain-containing protein [Victivallales bacterium]|nr:cupin domain-containing protein [Victivallales bacterium]